MDEWISVKGKRFRDLEVMDIFSKSNGRLCEYRFRKNFAGKKGNNFFEPTRSGPSCVRDYTHFMPIPEPPKD